MALHKEIEFENDICAHLAANGWLYAEGDAAEPVAIVAFLDDETYPSGEVILNQQAQDRSLMST